MVLTDFHNRKLNPGAVLILINSDVFACLNSAYIEVDLSCGECNTG